MKLFIFSIGGSGSRVVRSLSMLMASGVSHFEAGDQVFPIMIDYDVKNGDTARAFNCVDTYNCLYNSAFPKELKKTTETERRFFHTSLMKMSDIGDGYSSTYTMQFRHNSGDRTFGDAIAYKKLNDDKSKTKDLLNTLYDISNDQDTELHINMTVGFKGNPNIGSVVFNSLKDTNELQEFFRSCEEGDKVILIGSLFGGTGASGIPEIVKAIRSNQRTKDVHLGVIMLMPYFCFDRNDEVGAVKSGLFDSKTRAALSYYESSKVNEKIDSIYYIGDKERTKMTYSLGGASQKNNSHIVDLIGALSVLHFFKTAKGGGEKRYKYRMHDNEPDHAPGFTLLNFYKDDYDRVMKSLVKFAFAVKFFNDEIAMKKDTVTERPYSEAFELPLYFDTNGNVNELDLSSRKEFKDGKYEAGLHSTLYNFKQFSRFFLEWLKELKEIGNHKLVMFDFDRSIESLVQDCKLSKMGRGFLGGREEKNLVEALDFSEAVQKCYADKYQDAAPVNGALHFDKSTAGYALLDCLLTGIETILNKPEVASKLKIQ